MVEPRKCTSKIPRWRRGILTKGKKFSCNIISHLILHYIQPGCFRRRKGISFLGYTRSLRKMLRIFLEIAPKCDQIMKKKIKQGKIHFPFFLHVTIVILGVFFGILKLFTYTSTMYPSVYSRMRFFSSGEYFQLKIFRVYVKKVGVTQLE